MSVKRRSIEERFWEKVDRSAGPDACWPWTSTTRPDGYGVMQVGTMTKSKMVRANRLSLELALGGSLPADLHACHTCDNPTCVNPGHLYVGTHLDNMRDMVERRRQRYLKRPHCNNGHLWAEVGIKLDKRGSRICLACHPRAASHAPRS